MQKYFLFARVMVLSIAIAGCKDEETQVCSCSTDVDSYYQFDSVSVLTEAVVIPNAFSPNGDGRNDFFHVDVVGSVTIVSLVVKDGNTTVFQSSSGGGLGWDGRVNGTTPDCQTFDYVADVTLSDGTPKHFEGTVTVLSGRPSLTCPDNPENCRFEDQYPGLPSGENFDC